MERAARQSREGNFSTDRARDLVNQILVATGNSALDKTSTRQFCEKWMATKTRTKATNTGKRYGATVKAFLTSLGKVADKPLSAVQVRHVEDFRDECIDKGRASNSVRMEVKTMRAVFAQAVRQGLIATNPAAAVELDESTGAEKEAFTDGDLLAMLRVAPADWKTAILLGAYAGMRLSDAVNLTWDAVDFSAAVLKFKPQKTAKKGRVLTVPMHPRLAAHLEAIAGDSGGNLCPTLAGRGTGGKTGLSRQFINVMEAAGIDRGAAKVEENQARHVSAKSFHSLRHFFNTALLSAGVDEKTRMDLSGHTTTAINRKYSHAKVEDLRRAVNKIGAGD